MPAWKGVLAVSDIEALMAYISRAFHPVAGIAAGVAGGVAGGVATIKRP